MDTQMFDSVIVWTILALGLFVYQKLTYFIVRLKTGHGNETVQAWSDTFERLISALPLLGLLGTIMGLLDAFTALANGEGLTATSALSEGISSALWTTQLGLVIAVPAWMLLSYMKNLSTREELANAIQPATAP